MQKFPIGLIIKDLIAEKNLSIPMISKRLSISRQTVYQSFNRKSFDKDELEKWAVALETTVEEIQNRIEGKKEENLENTYLLEILSKIEKQMSEHAEQLLRKDEQLRRKDEQISQLLQTNNALVMNTLGKLKSVHNDRFVLAKYVNFNTNSCTLK